MPLSHAAAMFPQRTDRNSKSRYSAHILPGLPRIKGDKLWRVQTQKFGAPD